MTRRRTVLLIMSVGIFCALAGIAIGFLAGVNLRRTQALKVSNMMNGNSFEDAAIRISTDVRILTDLRGSDSAKALQLLKTDLDIALVKFASSSHLLPKERLVGLYSITLKQAAKYRKDYPREEQSQSLQDLARKADEALATVGNPTASAKSP